MTTPEKLRRRQLIEGVLLVLLGTGMFIQNWYYIDQYREQRSCLEENFSELSVALDARATLSAQEAEANEQIWAVWVQAAGLVKDDPTVPLDPEEADRLNKELVKALLNYQDVLADTDQARKENPIPPYPAGRCE